VIVKADAVIRMQDKTSRKQLFKRVTKQGERLQKIPKGTVGEGLWAGVHPTPYTPHPTPYTLHPQHSTLNPKP